MISIAEMSLSPTPPPSYQTYYRSLSSCHLFLPVYMVLTDILQNTNCQLITQHNKTGSQYSWTKLEQELKQQRQTAEEKETWKHWRWSVHVHENVDTKQCMNMLTPIGV